MYRRNLVFVVVITACFISVYTKVCEEFEISNTMLESPREIKRLNECTIVAGNVIVGPRWWAPIPNIYGNISFPNLLEIRGYFIVHVAMGLKSVGKLFPNLTVIRGNQLLQDYAFIVSLSDQLTEIGLKHLQVIEHGYIRIENCKNLCYYNYLKHIFGEQMFHSATQPNDNCTCPQECKEGCISKSECYERPKNCHEECIGCRGPRPDQCLVCKFMRDGNTCVSKCPSGKYASIHLGECVSAKQCTSTYNTEGKRFFVYNDYCLDACLPKHYSIPDPPYCQPCIDKCEKICNGTNVENLHTLSNLKHCTHLNGSLILRRINATKYAKELEENLQDIEEIDGFLKVERSPTLTSLDFLSNLRVIRGKQLEKQKYALFVFENENLEYLWNWTKIPNSNKTLKIEKGKISFHGNPQLCAVDIYNFGKQIGIPHIEELDISGNKDNCVIVNMSVEITKYYYDASKVTLNWKPFKVKKNVTFLGYLIYYTEAADRNRTLIYEEDTTDNVCDSANWRSIFWQDTSVDITKLLPYTQYAYYIKAFTSSILSGGQTEIQYFTTLPDDPSEPVDIKISSNTSQSIHVTWNPPANPNGVLSYYRFSIYIEKEDVKFVDERDYCKEKHQSKETKPTVNRTLSCHEACELQIKEELIEDKFASLCKNLYNPIINSFTGEESNHYGAEQACKRLTHRKIDSSTPVKNGFLIYEEVKSANSSELYISNLEPFTMYIIYMQACNENLTISHNGSEKQLCSDVVMNWQRTLRGEKSDDIPGEVQIDAKTDGTVTLGWKEPNKPNSIIVSYEIEYRRKDEEAVPHTVCITRSQFDAKKVFVFTNFYEGSYDVRIRAVSLAGNGRYTSFYDFTVPQVSESLEIVLVCIVLISLFLLVTAGAFYYMRKKRRPQLHEELLIREVNPDYAGPIYVEDHWEVDRERVQTLKELGGGTFGMVYSGFLITNEGRIECAIKTVTDNSYHNRMDFLNEAQVMKEFNDASHVIRLLGVVSRGDPPFVVMELMSRGDLKSYLRGSRDSSHNITALEMYKMAAEIADGMAYLHSKKFVHRDLAARNCMVHADRTVKVGDFGMARDVYETDYYRKETRGLLPVRWMAPESLADGVFTTDSDVWSYGVVLWEMVTLAEQPYQGLANEQVLQFIVSNGTLSRPKDTPDLFWDIMANCWKWHPNTRPMFIHIIEKLESHVTDSFKLTSYYHSKTGDDLRNMAKERAYNPPAIAIGPHGRGPIVHWSQEDDEEARLANLYGESSTSRPKTLLAFPYQRHKPSTSKFLEQQLDEDDSN